MTELTTFTDGGARGNPGPAAIGGVITDGYETTLKTFCEYIGETTNNQAEYKALIKALVLAKELKATHLNCNLDSELVVRQLIGQYKVREEGLKALATEALMLVKNFESVKFHHVPREKNKLADKLVNEALDKQLGVSE